MSAETHNKCVCLYFVCPPLKTCKRSVNSFSLHFTKVTVFDRFEIWGGGGSGGTWLFSREDSRSTAPKPGGAVQSLGL